MFSDKFEFLRKKEKKRFSSNPELRIQPHPTSLGWIGKPNEPDLITHGLCWASCGINYDNVNNVFLCPLTFTADKLLNDSKSLFLLKKRKLTKSYFIRSIWNSNIFSWLKNHLKQERISCFIFILDKKKKSCFDIFFCRFWSVSTKTVHCLWINRNVSFF